MIKLNKLTYRHALLVAMPIELLMTLVRFDVLDIYINGILSSTNVDKIVDRLVSRKDKNMRMPRDIRYYELHNWYPRAYIDNIWLSVAVESIYNLCIHVRIYGC